MESFPFGSNSKQISKVDDELDGKNRQYGRKKGCLPRWKRPKGEIRDVERTTDKNNNKAEPGRPVYRRSVCKLGPACLCIYVMVDFRNW